MTPLPAELALSAYYLEARSKLLDLAATLDRVSRGADAPSVAGDPRLERIRQTLLMLAELPVGEASDRAARVQRIFSLEYDSAWKIPEPR